MLSYSESFYNDTLHKRLIIYVMFRVYAEWLYSDCLYSECCYAECHVKSQNVGL
jgi:hypothetical protein